MKNKKTKFQELNINNIKIPITIKSYRTSKTVKFFFKNGSVTITKPNYLSDKDLNKMIEENEEYIYTKHIERTGKQ